MDTSTTILLGKRTIKLDFSEVVPVDHRTGSDDITGYQYTLNGRTYTDVGSFHAGEEIALDKDILIRTDQFGSKVLRVYHEIPTFDFEDREWDSCSIEYLFFDGRDIHMVFMRGGYKIARLILYKKLVGADMELQPYLKKLQFPIDGLKWH